MANDLYRIVGKRILDVSLASSLAVLTAPLIAAITLAVRVKLGSPVFFRQRRPGLAGRDFSIIKFRTMTDARHENGELCPDSDRLTRFGAWLRLTSLDELPELWNVIVGEMSLVGPRPLLQRYRPFYSPRERLREIVRPGITGWAQIHGRNACDWDARLEYDAWYAENVSFLLDLHILVGTVVAVLRGKGVAVLPASEMPDLDIERQSRGQPQ